MRDISSPLDGFASPFGPGRRTLTNLLFGQNEPGFTFEPWDITTLYQDRAGTTPVTAAGQSVGLRLDKSKQSSFEARRNLLTYTEQFDNAAWAKIKGGLGTTPTVTSGFTDPDGGNAAWRLVANSGGSGVSDYSVMRQTLASTDGARSIYIKSNTGASQIIYFGAPLSGSALTVTTSWTRVTFNAVTASLFFDIGTFPSTAAGGSGTTADVLIWHPQLELGSTATAYQAVTTLPTSWLGNHEVAVSDAKRGVYGWMPKTGRRNLLTYTEQFDNAVWTKTNATVTANAAVAPDGTMTADKLVGSVSALANRNCCVIQGATFTAGADHTLTFHSALAETPHVVIYVDNSGGLQLSVAVNLSTGVATAFNYAGVSAGPTDAITVGPIVNGYRKITLVFRNQGYSSIRISSSVIQPTSTGGVWWNADGDGTSGVYIWGAQLELGSTATAYQRVASQYDITEAGVPTCYYVQADGVDDAYVTPTITPNTDKAQVFAGVRKLSDATTGTLISSGTTAGTIEVFAPINTATTYQFRSFGSILSSASAGGTFLAPITNVITGLGDISGDTATLRVNGTQVAQSTTDQGTGNFLAYPAYIYARGGTTFPFNGLDFGHAVRFGPNLDAATIARVESLIARNTPEVTL